MADAYSTWIVEWHGGKTRAYVNAQVVSQTDKTATIKVTGCCNAWRITQYGRRIRVYIDGREVGTTTTVVFSRYGSANFGTISRTLTVDKGSVGRNVPVSCLVKKEVVDGYGASGKDESRTATVNVWVGAKTLRPPSAPSGLTAQRSAAGVLGLNWVNNANNAVSTYVERKDYDTDVWQVVSTQQTVVTSYADSVGKGTYRYRVRYANADGYSGYSNETEWVTALAAPAAPSIVSPLSGDTLDSSEGNPTLTWQHNSLDTSAQSAAQLKWTDDPKWLENVTTVGLTAESSTVIEALVGDDVNRDIYWQVRTKGAYDGDGDEAKAWSLWSAVSMFSLRTAPQIVLTVAEELTAVPIEVAWEYEDAYGTQAGAKVVLSDESGEVYSVSIEGDAVSHEIKAAEFTPINGKTYAVSVTVTSTTSLQGTAEASFTVAYDPPAQPVFSIVTDPDTHSNTVTVYETLYPVGTEYMNLFRDGELVAGSMTSGDSYVDVLPPLDKEMTYRVVSYAASGATSEFSQVSTVKSNGFMCVNWGEGGFAKMRRNLSNPDAVSGEKVVRTVASSRLPKVFYGTHATRSATASADVWQFNDVMGDGDSASLAAFKELEAWNGNVWLRFPFGDAFLATVDTEHDASAESNNWASVSVAWQEVSA